MYLTDEEKKLLDGEQGKIKQKCMQFLLAYGEAADAGKLWYLAQQRSGFSQTMYGAI